jgi:FixJ family two-component response regulator
VTTKPETGTCAGSCRKLEGGAREDRAPREADKIDARCRGAHGKRAPRRDVAAEGQTNRDIAQTLYVTPKTVELHLNSDTAGSTLGVWRI